MRYRPPFDSEEKRKFVFYWRSLLPIVLFLVSLFLPYGYSGTKLILGFEVLITNIVWVLFFTILPLIAIDYLINGDGLFEMGPLSKNDTPILALSAVIGLSLGFIMVLALAPHLLVLFFLMISTLLLLLSPYLTFQKTCGQGWVYFFPSVQLLFWGSVVVTNNAYRDISELTGFFLMGISFVVLLFTLFMTSERKEERRRVMIQTSVEPEHIDVIELDDNK